MFTTQWILGLKGAEPCLALRRAVFVEELGEGEANAFDWYDGIAAHLMVRESGDEAIVGAARLYPLEGSTRLDGICVRADKRGLRYGDLLVRMLLYKAAQLEQPMISVLAGEECVPYFKAFGFAPKGEGEGGRALLCVHKDEIVWDSPCKRQ